MIVDTQLMVEITEMDKAMQAKSSARGRFQDRQGRRSVVTPSNSTSSSFPMQLGEKHSRQLVHTILLLTKIILYNMYKKPMSIMDKTFPCHQDILPRRL